MICGKSGLVYDFIIYQGASTNLDKNDIARYGASASYVNALAKRIISPGHYLFYDNYFSNYLLLQDLRDRQIYAGGTIRLDRFGKPPLITDKEGAKKHRGFSDQVTNSSKDVVVLKWMDNKGVILASNFVGVGEQDEARRWNKVSKSYISIPRPELVRLYNNGVGGVDKTDHLISLYRIFIRSKKWTLRMIFHAIDLSLSNSWLEYQADCAMCKIPERDILDLLHFRQRVADSLLKMGLPLNNRKRGRPSSGSSSPISIPTFPQTRRRQVEMRPIPEVQYDTVDHLPEYDKKKEATRCKNPECKGKTHVYCLKCEIHLCFTSERNCFRIFHQKS
ncbi:piggyBac transposable element-derived protein 3-like [Pieris napi]|uniref:piggyBac transposable element-derived protein 3-like n=1 Tax=Pieris napi TaxID=78633 RepID=UPI001FBBCC27|nr:piggyBac transposable element-derived protein 3-like [Pieris napi]XP_047510429.1 piggyBac transposable element-derived protein 3-like [Pieris napi]